MIKRIDLEDLNNRSVLAKELHHQINNFHNMNVNIDKEIERLHAEYRLTGIDKVIELPQLDEFIPIFRPSGVSKCPRDLYYIVTKGEKDEQVLYPFQKRWTRNSSAVHDAVQKDFLYMEKYLENPAFVIHRNEQGYPAWEEHIKTFKVIEHKGEKFALSGMMDGILQYRDGSLIGFEFKTKSNSVGQVGTYKLKDAMDSHKMQCIAYSLMFGLEEFIIMYEAIAKDQWSAGENAKLDLRTFYYRPTKQEKLDLLDKLAYVSKSIKANDIPEKDTTKCLFCEYKTLCESEDV